jgi:peroxiredoxin 2/4
MFPESLYVVWCICLSGSSLIKNLQNPKAMKKRTFIAIVLFFSVARLWSQDKSTSGIPLIGDDAPSFTAESTNGKITFPGNFGSNWKILFSHPADFTPVCSSELLELAQKQNAFAALGVKIAVISTDTLYKHISWKKSLETLKYKGHDPVNINFPLIDDNSWYASKKYGMLHSPVSTKRDVRGVFIIDPDNKVRAIFFYPMEIGRNVDEILRTVVALQTADSQKVLLPANWEPGDDVLIPYLRYAFQANNLGAGISRDLYSVSWYMTFKKFNNTTGNK